MLIEEPPTRLAAWSAATWRVRQYCRMTLPTRMRAVLMTGFGGFEMLSVSDDVAVPTLGDGEVLLRVGAAAVNNTDINTRIGWYAKDVVAATPATGAPAATSQRDDIGWGGNVPNFPRIQGADACGTIVQVGPGVSAERVGERVLVEPVFRSPGARLESAVYFGSEVDGGFAEYTKVPSRHAHRIQCSLSDEALASFPCSYSAAENMINRAAVAVDEVVLVTGASGGVGSAAVQLARRRGASVIAVASADKQDALRALGASMVIGRGDDLTDALAGRPIDVVIDIVGGPQWPQLLDVMRPGGRYAVAGAIAGPVVSLDLRTLYLKDLRLLGCTVLDPEVFPNLVGYIERGEIQPLIAATFPLDQIVAAQQLFLTKQHVGKIVLRCD
jgi:NADPH:quinone reductase-like Zn-dependent oxidoreductase